MAGMSLWPKPGPPIWALTAATSAAELAERADTLRCVVQAVVELDEPYRETILLRYFEGLAIDAVAARMNAPLETTRARIRRGLGCRRVYAFSTDDHQDQAGFVRCAAPVLDVVWCPADEGRVP